MLDLTLLSTTLSSIQPECKNQILVYFTELMSDPYCKGDWAITSPYIDLLAIINENMCQIPECSSKASQQLSDVISKCTGLDSMKDMAIEKSPWCTTRVNNQQCFKIVGPLQFELFQATLVPDFSHLAEKTKDVYCHPCTLAILHSSHLTGSNQQEWDAFDQTFKNHCANVPSASLDAFKSDIYSLEIYPENKNHCIKECHQNTVQHDNSKNCQNSKCTNEDTKSTQNSKNAATEKITGKKEAKDENKSSSATQKGDTKNEKGNMIESLNTKISAASNIFSPLVTCFITLVGLSIFI